MMGIHGLYIQGDHDEQRYIDYLEAATADFSYIHHISGKAINIHGLTILGLSYFHTNIKPDLKSLLDSTKGKFDILLCHTELKRRAWLFELNCQYIVTGHFDHKATFINEKTFLSFGNDFSFMSYAIRNTDDKNEHLQYGLKAFNTDFHITFSLQKTINEVQYRIDGFTKSGKDVDINQSNGRSQLRQLQRKHQFNLQFIKGEDFKNAIESILSLKKQLIAGNFKWESHMMNSFNKLKVSGKVKISRTFVRDYLEELVL